MGGSKPAPPSASAGIPAAQQVSDIQQGYNVGAQAGSNYNQSNPYGSLTYTQSGVGPGGVPIYTANTNYSPSQAGLFDIQNFSKALAGAGGANLLTGANYGASSPTDVIGNQAGGITGGVIQQEMSYLSPFQQTERAQLDTQLKNQGHEPGDPAYDNAMRQLDTAHSMAVSKMIGDTTPQAYGIAQNLYNTPAMMAMALGGYGSPNSPATMYGAANPLQPANMTGAYSTAQQAAIAQYQAQMQQYSSMLSGMFGIPAAALGGYLSSPAGGAAATAALSML
jgi:hypothetical protein